MSVQEGSERERLIYQARLAEHCERYEDMVEAMKSVVQKFAPINVEERNLLSVGFKNIVGVRRSAWRTFNFMLNKNPEDSQLAEYMKRVEEELDEKCNEILSEILSTEFIEKSEKQEDKVFYLKMKGDYYRYMAEYKRDAERSKVAKKAKESYQEADALSNESLSPTDTIRLGLALNYSVFHFEILDDHAEACRLAKDAFDLAVSDIDQLQDGDYKDATLILQLLRDNLTLWQSETEAAEAVADEENAVDGQQPVGDGEDKDEQ